LSVERSPIKEKYHAWEIVELDQERHGRGGARRHAGCAGWGGDPQLTAVMNAVYAFTFTSPNSADSAVLLTLAPGTYTAQASSVTNAAGTTLVEVYEVP